MQIVKLLLYQLQTEELWKVPGMGLTICTSCFMHSSFLANANCQSLPCSVNPKRFWEAPGMGLTICTSCFSIRASKPMQIVSTPHTQHVSFSDRPMLVSQDLTVHPLKQQNLCLQVW